MKRFLLCYEFGSGYGHLTGLCLLAKRLIKRGHTVTVSIPEHSKNRIAFPDEADLRYSPPWPQPPKTGFSLTYADNFIKLGWSNAEAVKKSIDWWKQLFSEVSPDGIVVDFAPTPLLLARHFNLPRAILGNGFTVHPPVTPSPSLQPWLNVPIATLEKREQVCLDLVNPLLQKNGVTSLDCLASIVSGGQTFLLCYEELVMRKVHACEKSIGPLTPKFPTAEVTWPAGNGPRAFIYLRPNFMHYHELAQELKNRKIRCIVSGLDQKQLRTHGMSDPSFVGLSQNLDFSLFLDRADIVISHGSGLLSNRSAEYACKQLMFPSQLEQIGRAWHFRKHGLAESALPFGPKVAMGTMIGRLLEADGKNLQALANRLKTIALEDPVFEIIRYLERHTK